MGEFDESSMGELDESSIEIMGDENGGEKLGQITIDISHWDSENPGAIIFKIPRKLRKVNESAYTPQLVSIGPFHHGSEFLTEMESVKTQYYYPSFLNRFDKIKEDDLKDVIKGCSDEIRRSYEGIPAKFLKTESDAKVFDEMILRDACFILELFLRNASSDDEKKGKKDCIIRIPWLRKAIKLDLILLENQIPFFVLTKVYQLVKDHLPPVKIPTSKSTSLTSSQVKKSSPKKEDHDHEYSCPHICDDPLLKLTLFFFEEHYLTESCKRVRPNYINEIKHFTDLVREFWLPRNLMNDMKQESITDRKYLYSATKLDTGGVTFEPAPRKTCLTDVKISKKKIVFKFIPAMKGMRLILPELKIDNETESLLRNVMALEQCLYHDKDYICGYVALMDQLINTGEDVEFLVDMKILTNLLGSNKEAAKLINGLCNQIPRDKSYYASFYNELNTFYENRWNVTRATLKKVYFKDLWTGSSTVVGLFVLLFTVSATIKNVYFRHL